MSTLYSLRKSKTVLIHYANRFKKKKRDLNASQKDQIEGLLSELQQAIIGKDRKEADHWAKKLDQLSRDKLKKSSFQRSRDLLLSLLFALAAAVVIRSTWFEFYEIPSGSMRPTFKEEDRLVVSKTNFGINIPLKADHFYFDPALVQRNSTIIFTGANMDIRDVNTRYFYLFPGKKQYIKRLMGKPGDTLYFYGGALFGIDQDGRDITPALQPSALTAIDHVPFIQFQGKVLTPQFPMQGLYSPIVLSQMNEPVAKLFVTPSQQLKGEMLVKNVPDYGDLWGINNFAQVRLLTKEQAKQSFETAFSNIHNGDLYLELQHSPSLKSLRLGKDEYGRYRPLLQLNTSLIPLTQEHLKTLFSHLYTARFIIKNGFAKRLGSSGTNTLFLPQFAGVPDGVYEMDRGKGYKILWTGMPVELKDNHPLMQFNHQHLLQLFNLGIEFSTLFTPGTTNKTLYPSRFAYFRNRDLYVMGAPLLKKDDPILIDFIKREEAKAATTHGLYPYHPFVDSGPPLNADGTLNIPFIKQFGLTIPEHHYLALGDNYAMSADSRDFGFVPASNLRGSADFIFWPPGQRWGFPWQVPYPIATFPRLIIWSLAALIFIIWAIYRYRKHKLPLKW